MGHSEHLNLKIIVKNIYFREGVQGEVVPGSGGIGGWTTWLVSHVERAGWDSGGAVERAVAMLADHL